MAARRDVLAKLAETHPQRAVDEVCFSRPEFTAQWLMRLPAGSFQEATATSFAKNWGRFDAEAAHARARSLPEETLREYALSILRIAPFDDQ